MDGREADGHAHYQHFLVCNNIATLNREQLDNRRGGR